MSGLCIGSRRVSPVTCILERTEKATEALAAAFKLAKLSVVKQHQSSEKNKFYLSY